MITTIDPSTGNLIAQYPWMSPQEIENLLHANRQAFQHWRKTEIPLRSELMLSLSQGLIENKKDLAALITREMGKISRESLAEIEKCAFVCRYFAENAEKFLSQKSIETEMQKSYVAYTPLGSILAVMPWNFPFWQVFRFAAPALMAGNAVILKHASNTTGCGLAIEKIVKESGFPPDLFKTLIIENKEVDKLIQDDRITAVTVTGSVSTGRVIAKEAGKSLKKIVLELGGSDPYLILEDADLESAAEIIVKSRMQNSGQSCISPKRLLVVETIFEKFQDKVLEQISTYSIDNIIHSDQIKHLAPMAREDLRKTLDKQVKESVNLSAEVLQGGEIPSTPGFYYPATLLTNVKKGMPAYEEELFGPVLSLIKVRDEQEAIELANHTAFGLGAAVFTQDLKRGEKIALQAIEAGVCFVNNAVYSDPRLPFGGIKSSGYGRELSEEGIKEFVNIKTVVIH